MAPTSSGTEPAAEAVRGTAGAGGGGAACGGGGGGAAHDIGSGAARGGGASFGAAAAAAAPPNNNNVVDLLSSDDEDGGTKEQPFQNTAVYKMLSDTKPYSKTDKAKLLTQFKNSKLDELFNREFVQSNTALQENHEVIRAVTEKTIGRWSATAQAEVLAKFAMAVEENDAFLATSSNKKVSRDKAPVKQLRAMMEKCQTAAAVARAAPRHAKKGPAQKKPDGSLFQSDKQFDSAEAMRNIECPKCGLKTVNFLESRASIDRKNAIIKEQNDIALEEWTARGSRGSKPKKKPTLTQKAACYAYALSCGLQANGGQCYVCAGMIESGQQLSMAYDAHGQRVCACQTCQSSCALIFTLDQVHTIARAATRERDGVTLQQST